MNEVKKPHLGVLALMLEAYEPLFPGFTQRQTNYVHEVLDSLRDEADFVFPHVASNRETIEHLVREYNDEGLDGILILLLSYSQGQYLVRAMQHNTLPLALALVQPDETADATFGELELTVNQGIHGSQDNANCLMRAGIACEFFAGSRKNNELREFIRDFGACARARTALSRMHIAVIGKLAGMGDVITDDMAVYRKFGTEFVYDSVGSVQGFCAEASEQEIAGRMAYERTIFDIDKKITEEQHHEAVRLYVGLKHYLEENQLDGYTAQFSEFGADGRFGQLPLLAASNLLAEGYGYAAEGDATTAMMVSLMRQLCGQADFSEMYMMDFAREAILLCHAGEGNWAMARKDIKPFLMDRVLDEGGLANPPTPIFTLTPGNANVMSLVHVSGEQFKMVCSAGNMLDDHSLAMCDMPYSFYRPDTGVRQCVSAWLRAGGTHHETIVLGKQEDRIAMLCRMLSVDFVRV